MKNLPINSLMNICVYKKGLTTLLMFITFCLNAQVTSGINASLSPEGIFDKALDRFGTVYNLKEIKVNKLGVSNRTNQNAEYQAGIFSLYLEPGCGMDNTALAIENQRRSVLIQAFQDMSDFIVTPLKNIGNTQKVKIFIRNPNNLSPPMPNNAIGVASAFYNLPIINGQTAPQGLPINGGIIDNEIWKTINSGKNSFDGTIFPIIGTSTNNDYYHGWTAFNFAGNVNWNLDYNKINQATNYPINSSDFYTTIIHELSHALGFNSLMKSDGSSVFYFPLFLYGNYFTRYDKNLKNVNNLNLITNNEPLFGKMYNFNFSSQQNNLHPNCSLNPPVFNGNSGFFDCSNSIKYQSSITLPIYTPTCFENGSSLSHLEDACFNNNANDQYFTMTDRASGVLAKRSLTNEERQILCDIGYGLKNTFGSISNNTYKNYNTNNCIGIEVAGVNDGLNNSGGYIYQGNSGSIITINGILNNDYSANSISNLKFENLQDLYDPDAVIPITTGNNLTNITFFSNVSGLHLLRYVPFDNFTNKRGNITYIYVNVINNCNSNQDCNLVKNGNFEENVLQVTNNSQIYKACGWQNMNLIATADYFNRNASTFPYSGLSVPCNFVGIQEDNIAGNNGYAGMYFLPNNPPFNGGENIKTRLKNKLLPNTQYELSFDLSQADHYKQLSLKFQAFLTDAELNITTFTIPSAEITPSRILLTNANFSNVSNSQVNGWEKVKFTFTTTNNPNIEYLYLGALNNYQTQIETNINTNCLGEPLANYNAEGYYYVDNVELKEIVNVPSPSFTLPATTCKNNTLPYLSNFVQNAPPNGTFSGTGVTLNAGNIYSFNPTTSGAYTINYTYSLGQNCPPFTISDTITVSANCAQPYISQIYCGVDPTEIYIEVKNKSNTQTILAGDYYLNNYADGQDFSQPTSIVDIGTMAPLETKVFQVSFSGPIAVNFFPTPIVQGSLNSLPVNFNFNGDNDILTISKFFKNEQAYDQRVDLVGDTTDWGIGKSIVRSSCAVAYPRIDMFDLDDWVSFSLNEMSSPNYDINSKTNAILGRHNTEKMVYLNGNTWAELDLPPNTSVPDRSRAIDIFTADYNTGVQGNLEACSILINDFRTLTIAPNTYASVQIGIKINQFGKIDVQNQGNLVMVKDCYNGICGPDLVDLGASGTVKVTKETVGLDSSTDYVFWSSPLSNKASNLPANSIQGLFPSPTFNPNRFFNFRNGNYFDGFNTAGNPIPDAFDDNQNDYAIVPNAQRNLLMTPGQGYCNWPPVGTSTNYNIIFNGQANNGVITVPVFKNLGFGGNLNLVGNPYPSPIDLNKFFEVNNSVIEPLAFIWGRSNDDPSNTNPGPASSNYSADNYMVYNPTMMLVSGPAFPPFNVQGILSSCQSFFIHTIKDPQPTADSNSTGTILSAGNVIFNNSMRSIIANNTFARSSSNEIEKDDKIWLDLSDGSGKHKSQIGIAFLETASEKFDPKEDVTAFNGGKLNFYSKSIGHDLIINAQNSFEVSKIIALGITNNLEKEDKLTIRIDKLGGRLLENPIYLYDRLTSKMNNISDEGYTFKASKSVIDDRFVLLFDNKITSDISQNDANNVLVFVKDNKLNVISINDKKISSVEVVDIYTPSTSGIFIAKSENINNKKFEQFVDSKFKLLAVKIVLEDGSIINKKLML